jgi:ABC-type nitrate/sulfonate/bicarbonate transport system substrate-binding protein
MARFRLRLPQLLACVALSLSAWVVADGARAETVRVGIVGASSDAPFFIADAKGYFSAEGLVLELTSFDSGAKMVAPLGTGDLDAGGGAVSVGLYNAVKRGVGLKIVADKVHYGPGYGFASLLVRKELVESGKFKSYGDLKGLRVALSGVGIGDESVLNEALKRGGLKWGDAAPVYMGFAQPRQRWPMAPSMRASPTNPRRHSFSARAAPSALPATTSSIPTSKPPFCCMASPSSRTGARSRSSSCELTFARFASTMMRWPTAAWRARTGRKSFPS